MQLEKDPDYVWHIVYCILIYSHTKIFVYCICVGDACTRIMCGIMCISILIYSYTNIKVSYIYVGDACLRKTPILCGIRRGGSVSVSQALR